MVQQHRHFSDNNIMAFQTGTQVRPELGRADVSGFARAGMITGQALANLGQDIGNAITKYKVNEEKKAQKEMRYESLLPYTTAQFGAEEGDKLAKQFANDPKTAAQIMEFANLQREQNILNQAIGVSTEAGTGNVNENDFRQAYIAFGGQNLAGTLKLIDELSGPGEIVVKDGIITQDGRFMGQVPREAAERVPTEVMERRDFLKEFKKAQDLFSKGDVREAQNITISLGMMDKITGQPIPVSELFADIEVNPDPDSEPEPEPIPGPAPTSKSGFSVIP